MGRFKQRGFSLIEVMVALVILTTGVVALSVMQRQFIQASVRIQARGDALTLAESQLAVLLARPATDLTAESGNLTVPGAMTTWHLEWTTQMVAAATEWPAKQARVVQLTVSWTLPHADAETLTVTGWQLL